MPSAVTVRIEWPSSAWKKESTTAARGSEKVGRRMAPVQSCGRSRSERRIHMCEQIIFEGVCGT
uniref:Uncharacterized protein n=1 Tax=Hyaloperonospora arabidopsidis (strain Emoy2) TaxID=559515 RepID=M4BAC6_HYAAE